MLFEAFPSQNYQFYFYFTSILRRNLPREIFQKRLARVLKGGFFIGFYIIRDSGKMSRPELFYFAILKKKIDNLQNIFRGIFIV